MGKEVWRVSPSYFGYEVSSSGRIRSVDRVIDYLSRTGNPARRRFRGQILNPRIDQKGYCRVKIGTRQGVRRFAAVHQIVCEAFHGPCPTPTHEVAHGDGDKQNNEAANLRWATHSENMADRIGHGTHLSGERHPCAKITLDVAKEIVARKRRGESYPAISEWCGLAVGTVRSIATGRKWREAQNV